MHGLHTADLIRWIFGDLDVTGAAVATRRPEWPGGVPATSADSVAFTALLPGGAVCSVHTSWVARHGEGWRLAAHGSDGTLVATAAGHTGHFPVRLRGARADEPELRDLLVPGTEAGHDPVRGAGAAHRGRRRRRADLRRRDRGAAGGGGGGEPVTAPTVVLTTFADAQDAYRSKDLRQALYDEGEIIMADVLVNLHGDEHRARRRVENRLFRRETFELYERELFPAVIEATLAPYAAAGRVELVELGHEMMLNLAALTAGIDRPGRHRRGDRPPLRYMMRFIEGATLAHSTRDKDAQRVVIAQALQDWDDEFLTPSVERRRAGAGGRGRRGDCPATSSPACCAHARRARHLPRGAPPRDRVLPAGGGAHQRDGVRAGHRPHLRLDRGPPGGRDARPRGPAVRAALRARDGAAQPVESDGAPPRAGARHAALGGRDPRGRERGHRPDVGQPRPRAVRLRRGRLRPAPVAAAGVAPFGLSFAAGMHVCIGQDMAAGVVPGSDVDRRATCSGWSPARCGTRSARRAPRPDDPPVRDTTTARPYWGRYPVLLGGDA